MVFHHKWSAFSKTPPLQGAGSASLIIKLNSVQLRATISAWLKPTCPVIRKTCHLVQQSILIFDFPVRNYKSSPGHCHWLSMGLPYELNQPDFIGILKKTANTMLRTMDQSDGSLKGWTTTCRALLLKHKCEFPPLEYYTFTSVFLPAPLNHFLSIFACLHITLWTT